MAAALDGLHVLVTGVTAAIARDVVRIIALDGASVVAADKDAGQLARLERDVGLYRTPVETARIDLGVRAEVRLWEEALAAAGRLPHLMICCCGASAAHTGPASRHAGAAQPSDVALSDHKSPACPAAIAEAVLRPALFLHAEPLRRSSFDRALSVLRHPTLRGVLERAPGRGLFDPAGAVPYVRIASHLYSLRRQPDGDPPGSSRVKLVPSSDDHSRRANAA